MKKSELKQLIKLIITETKAYSGFKETKDSSEHTEKVAKSKSLTSTSKPVEKEEGKKLPVKDKSDKTETDHVVSKKSTPQPPAGEKSEGKKLPVGGHGAGSLKEDILGMIREALEAHRMQEAGARKDINKEIAALLAQGKKVYSYAVGRVGEVVKVDGNWVRFIGRGNKKFVSTFNSGDEVEIKEERPGVFVVVNTGWKDLEEGSMNEMAKKAIAYDGKTLTGSISNTLRKQDPASPTGWSLNAPYKMKDGTVVPVGTPVDAPAMTGKNYVKKGIAGMGRPKAGAAPAPVGGSEEEDEDMPAVTGTPPSKVSVVLDGKKIGTFNFRLASGKISNDDMDTHLYRIEDLAGHALDDTVADKYAELENQFFDDVLPANATLNLRTQRGPKGLTAVAV